MTKHIPAPDPPGERVIVIVMDGAGIGALPDAEMYGDQGSNSLRHVIDKHGPLKLDNLFSLGLGKLLKLEEDHKLPVLPAGRYGRMAPASPGKDTTSGHWELAGLIIIKRFPVYPDGFPEEIISSFERAINRRIIGNIAASGTEIIEKLGEEHLKTGYPIVYTSADSVFQIAAHEAVVSPAMLYRWCEQARSLLSGDHAVGRVIARPFTGAPGSFRRTAGRHDYSLSPPGETLLDKAKKAGYPVAVIGKVADIFARRGITIHRPGGNNEATAADLLYLLEKVPSGLIWATFGDFDTLYGHRNDSEGFARALEYFDRKLALILGKMGVGDLLFITADHGCDPTYPTTDHTREYVPILVWGPSLTGNNDLGTRSTFADLSATAGYWLNLEPAKRGRSFISN